MNYTNDSFQSGIICEAFFDDEYLIENSGLGQLNIV